MKDDQALLFDVPPDWRNEWKSMPEFAQEDLKPYQTIQLHFRNETDRKNFASLVDQRITEDTKSLWFPKSEKNDFSKTRYVSEKPVSPRFPIYIISKGRWESRLTSKALEKINVPYWIVVEPQEREEYGKVIDSKKILVLPLSNLGQGSIPARNWVWEHSLSNGNERHWILDDNLDGFVRLNNNQKIPVSTGAMFRAAEDFVDRYENVALSGFNYRFFANAREERNPPFTLNTRIYSAILIKNDIPYR